MSVALCLGAAECLDDDLKAALDLCEPDFIIACNDAIPHWPGRLDAAVSLHCDHQHARRELRRERGYPEPDEWLVAPNRDAGWQSLVDHLLPGMGVSGSSGLFAVKVGLFDFGADKAIIAGMPLDPTLHCDGRTIFTCAWTFRDAWREIPDRIKPRIRSMSGWTAQFLGRPDKEWLEC